MKLLPILFFLILPLSGCVTESEITIQEFSAILTQSNINGDFPFHLNFTKPESVQIPNFGEFNLYKLDLQWERSQITYYLDQDFLIVFEESEFDCLDCQNSTDFANMGTPNPFGVGFPKVFKENGFIPDWTLDVLAKFNGTESDSHGVNVISLNQLEIDGNQVEINHYLQQDLLGSFSYPGNSPLAARSAQDHVLVSYELGSPIDQADRFPFNPSKIQDDGGPRQVFPGEKELFLNDLYTPLELLNEVEAIRPFQEKNDSTCLLSAEFRAAELAAYQDDPLHLGLEKLLVANIAVSGQVHTYVVDAQKRYVTGWELAVSEVGAETSFAESCARIDSSPAPGISPDAWMKEYGLDVSGTAYAFVVSASTFYKRFMPEESGLYTYSLRSEPDNLECGGFCAFAVRVDLHDAHNWQWLHVDGFPNHVPLERI